MTSLSPLLLEEYQELTEAWTKRERLKRLINGDFALEKFKPLLEPHTFKGAFGGRASAKSYFFADLHLHYALERYDAYRALCLRQVQKSIRESLKFLLEQRMQFWGIGDKFGIFEAKIECPGGGEFVFHGLEGQTAESIKSFEGFHVADIEEGQLIKQRPLDLLIPTIIRKDDAEIWMRWNPRHDTDPVDYFWRGKEMPPDGVLVEVGHEDNPYLNQQTLDQIEADYRNDHEKASHIWGGGYEIITEGSYYAKWIAAAEREGRIGDFPYDPDRPVDTAWDIGIDDYTAVWFLQNDGKRVRVIDYYETSGDGAKQIMFDALPELIADDQQRALALKASQRPVKYKYGQHFFPHDVKVREWGAGGKSRTQTLRELGLKEIRIGVAQGPDERINASRALLPVTDFNKETTVLGVKRLRNYCRKFNETMQTYQGPLHDDNSHGADAFGEYAVNSLIRPPKQEAPPEDEFKPKPQSFEDMRRANIGRGNPKRLI